LEGKKVKRKLRRYRKPVLIKVRLKVKRQLYASSGGCCCGEGGCCKLSIAKT
jgi:hypothetical protein